MLLQHALPAQSLARWIHSYRHYVLAPDTHKPFTSLPGTGAELWLLESGELAAAGGRIPSGLLCLRSRPIEFFHAGIRIFAVRFRAGALPFFIDRPLADLIDHYTPLGALFNEASAEKLKAAQRAPCFNEQCHLADRFFISRLRRDRRLDTMQQLATVMYEQSAHFALSDYADVLQRDRSHLSRQFREIHGTSAKHFHRLCRFERFLRDALFAGDCSLAGLAIDHGYFDQAHLTREIQAFSRQSPRRLLAGKEARLFYSKRGADDP